MSEPERHEDGVFWEDRSWVAYVNGNLVAAGPDKPLIEAAYQHHAGADEYRHNPGGGADD